MGLVAQAASAPSSRGLRATPDAAPCRCRPDVFGTAPRELARSVSRSRPWSWCAPSSRSSRSRSRRWPRRATSTAARGGRCATPARSPSPPPRVRPGRRGARRLGRPARGAGASTRCCAARRTTSLHSRAAALGWGASDQVDRRRRADPAEAPVGEAVDGLRRTRRAARAGVERSSACRATGWSPSWGTGTDPLAARRRLAARFGRRAGRGRAPWSPPLAGRAARPGPRSPASSRRGPGPRRRGRCSADDLLPERVLSRRRRRPGARWWTGSTAAWPRPVGALLDTAAAYLEQGGSLEAAARTPVRPPQHRPLPAAPGGQGHRLGPDRPAGGVRPAGRPSPPGAWREPPGPRPARDRRMRSCGDLYKPAGRVRLHRQPLLGGAASGKAGRSCSPSSARVRAPRPPASSPPGSSSPDVAERARAGSAPSPGSTSWPTAPPRTPRRSATPRSRSR